MTLSGISMLIVYALLKFFENDIPDPRYEVNSLLDNAPNKLVFWVRYPKEISVKVYLGLSYTVHALRVLILRGKGGGMTYSSIFFSSKIHFRQISQTIDMHLLVSSSMGHLQVNTKQVGPDSRTTARVRVTILEFLPGFATMKF